MGQRVQIVGDDLLVTNPTRVKKALEVGACNALLLKVPSAKFKRLDWGLARACEGFCYVISNLHLMLGKVRIANVSVFVS